MAIFFLLQTRGHACETLYGNNFRIVVMCLDLRHEAPILSDMMMTFSITSKKAL